MDSNKVYAYTFSKYYYDNKIKRKNYEIKVGYTTRANVDDRIKEQISTSNPERPIKLYESACVDFKDHDVHEVLKNWGIERLKGEWFFTNVKTVTKAVNYLISGVQRVNSFKMRDEQKEAVDKAYNYYNTHNENLITTSNSFKKIFNKLFKKKIEQKFKKNTNYKFLWNAKMRFGKTFASYQLIKKLNAKKVLILTYKPTVVDEWRNELNNHVDFNDYNFIHALGINDKLNLKNNDILFASFQDILQNYIYDEENINKNYEGVIKPRFKNIFNEFFNLIIIDEVHWGATNSISKNFVDCLNYKNILYLSGTPFKILNEGSLSDDQIFTWTYIDEQNKKNEYISNKISNTDNPYWPLPKMSIIGYDPGESINKDLKYFDENEYFNFAKFFASKDGKTFDNQQVVGHFIDILSDKKSNVSPFFSKEIEKEAMTHTFWLLPNVNTTKALCYLLRQHHFFKDYCTVCASDNNLGEGKDTLKLVKGVINKKGYKGSITLSCGKLTTGVTVKEWGGILLLTNIQAVETYFQSIFRVQSAGVTSDKQNCYVFDFDSSRMLKLIYNYTKNQNSKESIETTTRKLLATMNLLCYTDSNFVNLDINSFIDMAQYGIGAIMLQKKFESRRLLNLNIINDLKNDPELMKILESIKIFRKINNTITIKAIESKNSVKKGKTYEVTDKEFKKDKKKRDKILEVIRQKLQRLITRLPIFMYLSIYVEEDINDVIIHLEPELFEETTGTTIKDFKILKKAKVFDIDNLNDAISAFKAQELRVLRNEVTHSDKVKTDILDVMANLSNEEVFTPVKIVNEVLDLLPKEVWYDKNLRWLNPACKNGVWLREIYRRLFKSLKDVILNEIERDQHIKSNMLFGYTVSNIAYKMTCKTLYAYEEPNDNKHIFWEDSPYKNNIKNKRFLDI